MTNLDRQGSSSNTGKKWLLPIACARLVVAQVFAHSLWVSDYEHTKLSKHIALVHIAWHCNEHASYVTSEGARRAIRLEALFCRRKLVLTRSLLTSRAICSSYRYEKSLSIFKEQRLLFQSLVIYKNAIEELIRPETVTPRLTQT